MRNIYYVNPRLFSWEIKKQNGNRAIKICDTKKEACDFARKIAKNNEPSQVVVKKKDGTIETEWTYGNDPFPPLG